MGEGSQAVTIQMTAAGLRRAANTLEALADIETNTGVRFDGAHNGYVMVSIADAAGVVEPLKLVRLPDEPGDMPSVSYALEFEVP